MPATLTWIDHDAEARDRMQRVLALFEERDTRDELGLGAIRDSFSDLLFPGTSTIQTRLRYFLLVPWVYRRMEDEGVPSRDVPRKARELELDISGSLLRAGEVDGVFGRTAGRRLKRLPSAVYWAGLEVWGIRRFRGTQGRYHQALDLLRTKRKALADAREEGGVDDVLVTWDPGLPEPPEDFPAITSHRLRRHEAQYLQDRVGRSCRGSLLAWLFLNPTEPEGRFPWEHPATDSFPDPIQRMLEQARRFSSAMEGAALLYNLLLAQRDDRENRIAEYDRALAEWEVRVDVPELRRWNLDELWMATSGGGHRITPTARRFVTEWIERVVESNGRVRADARAPAIVQSREQLMKGARSRFRNPRLLEQWGGASSPDPFNYRWGNISVLLADLHRGLHA